MVSSKTEICNIALLKLTRTVLTDVDTEDTIEAILCRNLYDSIRESTLREHPWNFAQKRSSLQRLATAPDFGFNYAYSLPHNYIRCVELYGTRSPFKVEGTSLLINDSVVYLIYISNVTDVSKFDPLFIDVLATKLAADLCRPLTGDESLRQKLIQEAEVKLRKAKRSDGQEGTPTPLKMDGFARARQYPGIDPRYDN